MPKSMISDFLDSQNGEKFLASTYFVGVLSFMGIAQNAYAQGNSGTGLWLSIASASCAFLAGMSVQRLRNRPSELQEDDNAPLEEFPEEDITPE